LLYTWYRELYLQGRVPLPPSTIKRVLKGEGLQRTKVPYIYGNILFSGDTKVYTGHGDPTTIGEEKNLNGFVRL
jgi:hypothetical protein